MNCLLDNFYRFARNPEAGIARRNPDEKPKGF